MKYYAAIFLIFLAGCATSASKPSALSQRQDMESAVSAVAQSMKDDNVSAKYCPLCARHYNSRVIKCPRDGTVLKNLKE